MELITHGTVDTVFWTLLFCSVGAAIVGFIITGVSSDSYADAGVVVGVVLLILGIVGTVVFAFYCGINSSQYDTASNKNLEQQAHTVYGLTLSEQQANRLLTHHTITLTDGRKVFLRHVEAHEFELRRVGPSFPLDVVAR